ncbi:MAG: hypothetical protein KME11_19740 [Timaviella obliquedivisa GSE-PSE-MK23-08B]|nr:hypothetical protein [Timaviella obliquedivisa GSE-PSE-MK23-08B]
MLRIINSLSQGFEHQLLAQFWLSLYNSPLRLLGKLMSIEVIMNLPHEIIDDDSEKA